MTNFIDWLTRLKYWQIVTLGALATLAGLLALAFLAHVGYNEFPDAFGWVLTGHLLGGFLVAWFVPGPFIEAYLDKQAMAAYKAAWRRLLDEIPGIDLDGSPCQDGCELPNEDGACADACLKDPNA